MNVSFDLYRVFYYVCKYQNITRAANALMVSQPAVTKQVKNLEGLLGVTLISKTSKGIVLTKEGENLYQRIKESVETFENIEKTFQLKEENYEYTIRIIANYSVVKSVLLDVIDSFSKKHPNIRFEIGTYRYDIAFSKLRDGECDLVLLNYKESMKDYSDIQVHTLYFIEDIFIASKEEYTNYPTKIPLKNICSYPLVCKEKNAISTSNLISYLESVGEEFCPKYTIDTDWMIEEYVKRGLGIGLVPYDFVKEELGNSLERIQTDVSLPLREICYAIRKNSVYYSVLQEFIMEIKKKVKISL